MIKEINMRSCATYDADGVSLKDCTRVNFIYGPNGSGKSTISNYLQNPFDPFYASSNIVWNDALHPDVMVYNRRFREQNFSSNSDIQGVFTLGSATIEDIQKLDELKAIRKDRKTAFDNESNAYKRFVAQREESRVQFRDTVWNIVLKSYEGQFKDAFSGLRNNKDKFRDHVLERFKQNHSSSHTYEELISRSKSLYASKPETCELFAVPQQQLLQITTSIESDTIFQKVIAGDKDIPISKLIQSLQNSDWVSHGRHYLGKGTVCPFCQKNTIDTEFRKQLEDFFSGEYEQNLACVEQLYQDYKRSATQLLAMFKNVPSLNYSCQVGRLNTDVYSAQLTLLENVLTSNISIIVTKKNEPGTVLDLKKTDAIVTQLLGLLNDANEEIKKHNQMVLHLSEERKKLTDDIWSFLMDKEEALIQGYLRDEEAFSKAKNGRERKLRSLEQELGQLNTQIVDAGKNVTSVQPTVDEIIALYTPMALIISELNRLPTIPICIRFRGQMVPWCRIHSVKARKHLLHFYTSCNWLKVRPMLLLCPTNASW